MELKLLYIAKISIDSKNSNFKLITLKMACEIKRSRKKSGELHSIHFWYDKAAFDIKKQINSILRWRADQSFSSF